MSEALRMQEMGFASFCKQWRQYRKLSQLELALAAEVSQRHVSWLETGRSKPSREMVIRLSDAMDMPLRERNVFLQSAGYASIYSENALEAPAMEAVLAALRAVLRHHDPLPALVVDRFWNVRMINRGAEKLLGLSGDIDALWQAVGDDGRHNLALLTLHPKGLRPFIANWALAAPAFVKRLKREMLASGDREIQQKIGEIIALAEPLPSVEKYQPPLVPVLPLELAINSVSLKLFSVFSIFGTPQDVTTEELRIEAFYPSDESTREFFMRDQR